MSKINKILILLIAINIAIMVILLVKNKQLNTEHKNSIVVIEDEKNGV